jgi:hypothetical protein
MLPSVTLRVISQPALHDINSTHTSKPASAASVTGKPSRVKS